VTDYERFAELVLVHPELAAELWSDDRHHTFPERVVRFAAQRSLHVDVGEVQNAMALGRASWSRRYNE
jgi:hypothetical protein